MADSLIWLKIFAEAGQKTNVGYCCEEKKMSIPIRIEMAFKLKITRSSEEVSIDTAIALIIVQINVISNLSHFFLFISIVCSEIELFKKILLPCTICFLPVDFTLPQGLRFPGVLVSVTTLKFYIKYLCMIGKQEYRRNVLSDDRPCERKDFRGYASRFTFSSHEPKASVKLIG